MKKRGQISVEFIITVGFAFLMIIPLTLLLYDNMTKDKENIDNNQAGLIAKKITDSANSVYYLGYPSAISVEVYMPDGVNLINFTGREITIGIANREAVSVANVNLTGYIKPSGGLKKIKISAMENLVNITEDVS